MAEHKIAILNRIAVADAGIELVCNNPTDTIRFEFDEEWSGIAAKTARFSWDGKYKDVPFSGNEVVVPEIFQTNHVYVGVFADNIASTPAKVKCRYSIKCLGGKVVPPSEDVYAQIIALINAGINANDGVGVSNAFIGEDGHLFITLTTGESIDCGKAQGKDGEDGKDGAGAEEYAAVLESIAENKAAIEQNATDIETLETNLDAFEKNRPFDLTGNPVQVETFEGMPLNPVTVLEPQQEGSGDPYPAGGGKNLCSFDEYTTSSSGSNNTEYAAKPALTPGQSVMIYGQTTDGVELNSSNCQLVFVDDAAIAGEEKWMPNPWIQPQTVPDEYANATQFRVYTTPALAGKTIRLMIEVGTSATGWVPAENIRPFIGYDALDLTAAGKNLANLTFSSPDLVIVQNADGTITAINNTDGDIAGAKCELTGVLPAGTYTISKYDTEADVYLQASSADYSNSISAYTFNYDGVSYLRILCSNVKAGESATYKIQLELGSAATPFESHKGKLHIVQIGQTVYGGKFDWLTGVLTVERAMVALDGVTESMTLQSVNAVGVANYALGLTESANVGYKYNISSHYPQTFDLIADAKGPGFMLSTANLIYIRDVGHNTLDEYKAYLAAQYAAGTPVQIAYKLATPIEIQLTPHEILALQGVNTLYGDGEITINGRSDMQAVVSNLLKRIATLEATINS